MGGGGERVLLLVEVSRLVRGGKVKLTGGGDLSGVYGREVSGSGESVGCAYVCILSRRGVMALDIGA